MLVTGAAAQFKNRPVPVNVHNFIRAETDLYFSRLAVAGFGKFNHRRTPVPIDDQTVVRMNRDTLYSSAIFDLDAAPVTVTLPDAGGRFMSLQVISQDHYSPDVIYAPGRFTFDRGKVGTRYMALIIRTFVNADDAKDVAIANRLQDAVTVGQDTVGVFEVPLWDAPSQDRVRGALFALAMLGNVVNRFGKKGEVDPFDHLIGTATGWGGNPRAAAEYQNVYPFRGDGESAYRLTLKDVPVDGFWSVSVYNAQGFFEKNDLNAYSLNNLTAKRNGDGAVTIQFGDCTKDTPNCLPVMPGWSFTMRFYRPGKGILDGSWKVPTLQAVE
jgi:para-nitrobenzyl esterase